MYSEASVPKGVEFKVRQNILGLFLLLRKYLYSVLRIRDVYPGLGCPRNKQK
jgi:hypothetical protein